MGYSLTGQLKVSEVFTNWELACGIRAKFERAY